MASRSEVDYIATTNLTLAAYLLVEGCESRLVLSDDRSPAGVQLAAWQFIASASVRDLIDDFNDSEAMVEPQAFHRSLTSARRKLFRFLEEQGLPKP